MVRMQIQLTAPDGQVLSTRATNRIRKAGALEAMTLHAKMHLPQRVEPGANIKYGYTPRSEKWIKYKNRIRPGLGSLDMVWTGSTRSAIRKAEIVATGGPRSWVSVKRLNAGFRRKRAFATGVHLRKEMATVTAGEVNAMRAAYGPAATSALREELARAQRTRKV